ncbi:hypothetical protein I316_04087 [Kwoniella heveanensis BCC8398]|uniref:CASTOR ACT domain-containing protein n=1 Tax=Kwoniella heveanensis BCC8398 TaxID=1296120 RepID=A0A1B9GT47_9TREE|nr:hypothetical protein I316_04087 [Kwoniella heveanensis BCC8398]
MANPKNPSNVDKAISVLHLLPQPNHFHTFSYPLETIPSITPDLYTKYPFFSTTKEEELISVVVAMPKGEDGMVVDGEVRGIKELGEAERWYGPWRAIKIRGPLYMGMTGILNEMSTPLRQAEIGIYAISTWPTDYVLVPANKLEESLDVLRKDGWKVIDVKAE